jgi:hypothetical protein
MISALAFIPRGAAKETPDQTELSKEEIDMLVAKQAGLSVEQVSRYRHDIRNW